MERALEGPAALRAALQGGGVLVAPSVFDGLSLRAVERAGFRAAHVSGSAGAGSAFGLPDIGLVSMTEVVEHVRRLAATTKVPLVADGDTGYGGPSQVARFVSLLERAGAAAVHLEDQSFPKRCGFLPGKSVVDAAEFAERLAAAAAARSDPDFLVIARTDALDLLGVDEAVARCRRYRAAGADLVFVEGISSRDELEVIGREVAGPKMLNMVGSIASVEVTDDELAALGYALVIYPALLVDAASRAMDDTLGELAREGRAFRATPYLGPVGLARSMGIEAWLPGLFDAAP
ncbi:MAG TPA: isocitrate lyase/PEP mutase family protein [Acidimicrobiales bacterium]|nr:isocitrate lyase/PEP mutase family protein [Acidimicrobiales bacterium]